MKLVHVILGLVLALALVVAFIYFAWRSSIAPVDPPTPSSFDAALIAKGAELALIANCNVCHTAEGHAAYAGGRPLKTPFGTMYGTNITPDPVTGIGKWSVEAFTRAMREGVDREGRHLYPAFPYDHFTRMPDEDIKAIYAFIMTRSAVRAEVPAHELNFPFNIRMLVAAWKALYLRPGAVELNPAEDPEWNRGAYLVEGPAHCGGCHTPRNWLGAEKKSQHLAGGVSEGWHAPALNAASPAPAPWTAEALFQYLRHGVAPNHAAASGPMLPVVHNLSSVSQPEVQAIADYVASFAGKLTLERQQRAQYSVARARNDAAAQAAGDAPVASEGGDAALQTGRAIYAGACAVCHDSGRQGSSSGTALHLALSTSVNLGTPGNLIRIVLDGIAPPDGERGASMPGFAGALTDEQVVALARYVRTDFAKAAPWSDVEGEVKKVQRDRERKLTEAVTK
jgi:mono/diheme cytochrome c family protein